MKIRDATVHVLKCKIHLGGDVRVWVIAGITTSHEKRENMMRDLFHDGYVTGGKVFKISDTSSFYVEEFELDKTCGMIQEYGDCI